MKFIDTLKKYGIDDFGYPSEITLEQLYKLNPNLDEALRSLIEDEQNSVRDMSNHTKVSKGKYVAIKEEYVPLIQAMIGNRYSKSHSMNEYLAKLAPHGYPQKARGQLVPLFNRIETKLGLAEKLRANQRQQKARQEQNKRDGIKRRQPNSKKQQESMANARKIGLEKRKIAKAEREAKLAKKRLAHAAAKVDKTAGEILNKEKEKAKQGLMKTVSAKNLEDAREELKKKDKKILYEPTPKQAEFHAAGEDVVLYGGAAGGGKSYAMLVDALRYCQEPDYRGLIIRRTSPMLKELIGVSRVLYKQAFPGAKFNKSDNMWYFPSGATIQFGYLDRPEDLDNYQGLPYAYIGFDEIQHQRGDDGFLYLMSRLRSANPNIKCYIRASANPGGAPWVKERFIDPAEPNTTFYVDGLSYRFIPAKLEDNPYLDTAEEGEEMSPYRKMLMALPEVQRKQLLDGDWMAGDDNMFSFVPPLHVTKEMPPSHWNTLNALDYGYNDPAAALWGAVCPTTGTIVVYQELECLRHEHAPWAEAVKKAEGYIPQGVERVIDHSVFNMTGHTGPGVREVLARYGLLPKPADRSREAGWNQIAQRLLPSPTTGQPTLLIHESCEKLIEQLMSAKINEKKPEDIDEKRVKTKGRMHHWDLLDTLRYMVMARPQLCTVQQRAERYKEQAQKGGFEKIHSYFS